MRLIAESIEARTDKKYNKTITIKEVMDLIERMLEEFDTTTDKAIKYKLLTECSKLGFSFYKELPFFADRIKGWHRLLLQYFTDYLYEADKELYQARIKEIEIFTSSFENKSDLLQTQALCFLQDDFKKSSNAFLATKVATTELHENVGRIQYSNHLQNSL
jgi:hypothetical protein